MIEHRRLALIGAVTLMTVAGMLLLLALLDGPGRTAWADPDILYVALDGDDVGDCSNEIDPCRTVQYAVDQSPTGGEIRIATGIYTGVRTRDGRTQVVYISKTVIIRGGYTTSDWNQADPDANPTTLDAEGQGRVVYVTSDIGLTMEGLRITGGDAAWGGGSSFGGGVYIEFATTTISDCRVYSNTAGSGGGLYLYSSSSTLDANIVTTNTATFADVYDGGGGLYLHYSGATLIGNTVVSNTTGGRGGGVHLYDSDAVLSGNRIVSNTAAARGGGAYLFEGDGATLVGNTVSGNTTRRRGGGVCLAYSGATLSGNTVISNTADGNSPYDGGGGLYLFRSDDATLIDNIIFRNEAIREGGGLYLNDSVAELVNNVVADNRANAVGSGIYVYGSDSRLLHTTIARNSAGDGSGVHIAYSEGVHSNVVLTNTILVSHTIGVTVADRNSARLEATLWGDGVWGNTVDWGGDGAIFTGTNNIRGEPGFVDPANGDYHITVVSAARDAGVDAGIATDLDGEPRPYCYLHDIGADEFWPPVSFGIEISGPVSGTRDVPYTFTATVEPPTATLPVSYTWSATGQISTAHTGGISDTAIFTWHVGGPQVITVTAVTGCGVVVSTTHALTVECGEFAEIEVAGPVTATAGTPTAFTATVQPPTATLPIKYTWSATGQISTAHTGGISDTAIFTWHVGGPQVITVTAVNACGVVVSTTHAVTVGCGELTGMEVAGPVTTAVGVPTVFAAIVQPPTATLPITYTWEAMEQPQEVTTTASTRHAVTYSWATVGSKIITATAINACGVVVSATRVVEVVPWNELIGVEVAGPVTATVGIPTTFTATVQPPTATLPITYTWEATGQASTTHGGGISDTMVYTWKIVGRQTVTVTAVNGRGTVISATHVITTECKELIDVDIVGPPTTTVDSSTTFTATVTPLNAARPITYTWEATGQASVTHRGSVSDMAVFTWHITGLQAITVTSVNACGMSVSKTRTLTVVTAPCITLDSVKITGPTSGTTNTAYVFVAVITPSNATEPIAYEWTPEPNSGQGTANTVHSWTTAGKKTISVTVDNCGGVGIVTSNHMIIISGGDRYVYLPVVLRN